jgi:hypothetical protein
VRSLVDRVAGASPFWCAVRHVFVAEQSSQPTCDAGSIQSPGLVLRGWPSDGAGIGFLRLDQLVDALVQLRVLGTIRYALGR